MSLPPPPRPQIPGIPPQYQGQPAQYRTPQQQHVAAQHQATAPTLGQYFRSDTRTLPGRKAPKWAGRTAFWLGLLAAGLLIGEMLIAGAPGLFASFAAPLSVIAVIFALIAIIAGIGRGLGIFGLVFALAGSTIFWSWLDRTFG